MEVQKSVKMASIATLDSHIGVLLWEENYEEAQHKRRNYERFYLLTMEMLVT
jgi:hypothetical protein